MDSDVVVDEAELEVTWEFFDGDIDFGPRALALTATMLSFEEASPVEDEAAESPETNGGMGPRPDPTVDLASMICCSPRVSNQKVNL